MNRQNSYHGYNDSWADSCCDNNDHDHCCMNCPPGPRGETSPAGPQGSIGETGSAGGVLNYADFYALMPPDNAATVAPGTDRNVSGSFPGKCYRGRTAYSYAERGGACLYGCRPCGRSITDSRYGYR